MVKKYLVFLKSFDFRLLLVAFFVSIFLRVYYLNANAISYAFDQARDAFIAKEIIQGDFKILGPSVSGIPGLYHGVLYYYFIAPFYALGGGNPVVVAYAQSFFNSFGVFVAYLFCFLLTKKSLPSLVSAFMFAFSFEASQYANLLSNPAMAVLFVPLTYIGLYLWISNKPKIGSILTGLFLGLSIQSEIALGYHLFPILVWLFIYRKKLKIAEIVKSFIVFLLSISTILATEIKFGFKGLSGIMYLMTSQDGIARERGILEILIIYVGQVSETFSNNIFPAVGAFAFAGVLFLSILFFLKKTKKDSNIPWQFFLISSIAPQIIALPFGGTNMRHIMVGSSVGICVFTSILLFKLFSKNLALLYFLVLLVFTANLMAIFKENKFGQTIFPLQQDLTLANELKVVSYTYKASSGSLFSINTVTSPLWINTLWSYLYNWQSSEYGYLPRWTGKDQVGQLGNNLEWSKDVPYSYLIIEPTYGIPEKFIRETIDDENSRTKILEEIHFGDIIVQKREPLN